ncbi:hypothetical protein BJX70DRAFT_404510 [Aspergillus crustosus]
MSEKGYNALFGAHTIASSVVNSPFGSPDLYGFGWILQTYKGARIIQHGGAQDGFGAFVVLLPEKDFGIDDALRKTKFSNETLASLYPDLPSTPGLLPHPLNLSSYTGTYTHPAYPTLLISSDADCPTRKVLNNPEKWTGARLCAEFTNPASVSMWSTFDLFHVSGEYWTAVLGGGGAGECD